MRNMSSSYLNVKNGYFSKKKITKIVKRMRAQLLPDPAKGFPHPRPQYPQCAAAFSTCCLLNAAFFYQKILTFLLKCLLTKFLISSSNDFVVIQKVALRLRLTGSTAQ